MKVAELRQMCDDRGLSTAGLKKSDLVDLLASAVDANDAPCASNVSDFGADDEVDDDMDDEVQLVGPVAGNAISAHLPSDLGDSESASLRALKLKFQLEEADRQSKLAADRQRLEIVEMELEMDRRRFELEKQRRE